MLNLKAKFPVLEKISGYNFAAFLVIILFIYEQSWAIQVPRPFTMWVSLLAVFLPGIWRLGKIILSRAGFSQETASILTPAVTIALWVASVHLAGLAFHNFYYGLISSNIILGVTGYILPGRLIKFKYQAPDEKHIYVAVLNCFIIAPVVFLTDWHDTNLISGHFSLTEQILNGAYPPHHLTFPEYTHPSHYGINTFYASVAAVLAFSVESAIDLTTFLLWFYTGLLGGYISKKFFGEKNGALGVFITCFASGFPFFAMFFADDFTSYKKDVLVGLLTFIPPKQANQPISHFFFQHPFSIGLPIFLSLIIAFFVAKEKNISSKIYYGIIALFIFILGIGNTSLFLATIGALGACILVQLYEKEHKDLIIGNFYALAVGIIGFVLFSGSFDTVSGGVKGSISISAAPLGGDLFRTILWNFDNLGLIVILAAFGLYKLKEFRLFQVFAACIIVGGVFIFNVLVYKHSHDIIKFSVVANIIAAILAVGALGRLRSFNVYIYRALLVMVCFNGVTFPFVGTVINPFADTNEKLLNVHKLHNLQISNDAIDTMAWLRANVKNTEIVLQSKHWDLSFAMHAGLASFRPDWGAKSFAFSREHIALREDMLRYPEKYSVDDFYKQGVRWIVIKNSNMKKDPFALVTSEWEADEKINNMKTFGDFQIYQIHGNILVN